MENSEYGPIAFLIGKWKSKGHTGENQAPDPNRETENTKFRQEMNFEPIGDVDNHEQKLFALRYSTKAWEEGNNDDPFHEEVGYFIWDGERNQVMKSFIVPRGISVNAGGECLATDSSFKVEAELGSPVYGLCSNPFLDKEFKTLTYEVSFKKIDQDTFSYDENTRIQMKNKDSIFDHTERNTMIRA